MPIAHYCYKTYTNDSRKKLCKRRNTIYSVFGFSNDEIKGREVDKACRRKNFTIANVTIWDYICNKHSVDPNGSTLINPEYIPVTTTVSLIATIKNKRK